MKNLRRRIYIAWERFTTREPTVEFKQFDEFFYRLCSSPEVTVDSCFHNQNPWVTFSGPKGSYSFGVRSSILRRVSTDSDYIQIPTGFRIRLSFGAHLKLYSRYLQVLSDKAEKAKKQRKEEIESIASQLAKHP